MLTSITRKTLTHILLVGMMLVVASWAVGGMWRWLVVVGVSAIVPGFWLYRWAPWPDVPRVVRWSAMAALGPMAIAVVYMWAAALHVALPVDALWWSLCIGALLIAWQWRASASAQWVVTVPSWAWGSALFLIMAVVIWSRQQQIQDLVLPAWVDGVHHSLLVRVAYERNQAPWDVRPYLPVPMLTFHSGYHSVLAAWMHWAGIVLGDVGRYVLLTGQMLNVMAVVSVAVLAWHWWRSWAGVAAVLAVCGLMSIMPAYYVAWGRYTLLMGMVLLPIAMMVLETLWQSTTPRVWIWGAMLFAGLALTHMVVFAIWLLWGGVLLVTRGRPACNVWWSAIVAVGLTAPWWWLLVTQTRAGAGASAMNVVGNDTHNAFIAGLFWALNNQWLIPGMAVVCWWALRRQSRPLRDVVLWMALVALCANLPWIGLPYISFFTNETITTALYLPLGIAAAWLAMMTLRYIPGVYVWVALVIGALAFAPSIQSVVRDETILVTADDEAVLRWAQTQPWDADALVLTSAQRWMWGVDRGDDGGWWLLPLAGIQVTTPPVLYTYGPDQSVQQVRALTAEVRDGDGSVDMVATILQTHPAITHVYASERSATLHPSVLRSSPWLEELYSVGDVALFRVKRTIDAQ